MAEKILFSWSSGKDSSLALYELQKQGYKICALLTTITQNYDRVSMHGVRTVLLEQQASSIGCPLEKILISAGAPNSEYESKMREVLEKYKSLGVTSIGFGDIFLENLKKYREEKLSAIGMKGIFPLWGINTGELARRIIRLGFKAIITCVDSNLLDRKFAGREFNEQFLSELPANIDPCGENGEFHSFTYAGPIFKKSIPIKTGEVVLRDNRFYFCDLIPK